MNQKPASLSIVFPCYNEEKVVHSTYGVLKKLCESWKNSGLIRGHELVFVNDGSIDSTFEAILELYKKDKSVVFVDLRKNVGFQGAISAGLFSASGDMVVSIDADLQDDPTKIEEMIKKYYEGYEMVLGIRENRESDTLFKKITAQWYYRLLRILGAKAIYNHGDFRLMSRNAVEALKKFPERVRYLRSLIFEVEPRYATVYYKRTSRKLGKSKFNLSKMISFAIDGITSFSSTPIRLVSWAGVSMFLLSIMGLLRVIYVKYFLQGVVPGWTSLAVVVLFFGGIQTLFLGVIGEYIAKLYTETKQRPIYLIRKEYRHQKNKDA